MNPSKNIFECKNCGEERTKETITKMKAIRKPDLLSFEFAKRNGKIETGIGSVYYKKGDAIFKCKTVKGRFYYSRESFDENYCILDSSEGEIDVVAIYKNKEGKLVMQVLTKITGDEK